MHHPENEDIYKGLTVNAGVEQPSMVNPYMKPKKRKRLFTPAEYVEGIVKGDISTEKHGTEGFGYDPVFVPEGYSESFAELGADVKNKISHRALAVEKLVTFLKEQK